MLPIGALYYYRDGLNRHHVFMSEEMSHFGMQDAWDRASSSYLTRRGDDVTAVSYGNLAPSEAEVGLLGDLHGLRVLDLGCGGGQNAVACTLAGATVVGIDLSATQLSAAQALAREHGVTVEWHHGNGLEVASWQVKPFDLLLAIQVLPYVNDPAALLRSASALLRPGGRAIVSLDHPMRDCFFDVEMEELVPYPARSYFDAEPVVWKFAPDLPMQSHHHPLGQWIAWVVDAGLQLQQLIEAPASPEICDDLWPEDSPLAPLRAIPHTAILVAQAPN